MLRKFIQMGAITCTFFATVMFCYFIVGVNSDFDNLYKELLSSPYGIAIPFLIGGNIACCLWDFILLLKNNGVLLHETERQAETLKVDARLELTKECNRLRNIRFAFVFLYVLFVASPIFCTILGLSCRHGETCFTMFIMASFTCMLLIGVNELVAIATFYQGNYLVALLDNIDHENNKIEWERIQKQTHEMKVKWDEMLARVHELQNDYEKLSNKLNSTNNKTDEQ